MQKSQINIVIINQLSGEATEEDNIAFFQWYNSNEENKIFFNKVKAIWDAPSVDAQITFRSRFTTRKVLHFISNKVIGNLIGFAVAFSITRYFTHVVVEKKSINNLFGILKRKKHVVHDLPEWLQSTIAIVVGFVVLEFINYFFESKKHIMIWNSIRKSFEKR